MIYLTSILFHIGMISCAYFWLFLGVDYCKYAILAGVIVEILDLLVEKFLQYTYIDLARTGRVNKGQLRDTVSETVWKPEHRKEYVTLFYLVNREYFLMSFLKKLFLGYYIFLIGQMYLMGHIYFMILFIFVETFKLTVWDLKKTVAKLYMGGKDPGTFLPS